MVCSRLWRIAKAPETQLYRTRFCTRLEPLLRFSRGAANRIFRWFFFGARR
jgi:hypothetical protein